MISTALAEQLPPLVRRGLEGMDELHQEAFEREFRRKRKWCGVAYIAWFFGMHYAYLGRWGALVFYLVSAGGLFVWMLIDLFRMRYLVSAHNEDLASEVFRNVKATA